MRNEGVALLLTLGFLVVLVLFTSVFLASLNRAMTQQTVAERDQRGMAIAEGGLDKALVELRRAPDTYAGEENTPLGSGAFTVAVTRDGEPGLYRIVAAGVSRLNGPPGERACITAEVRFSREGVLRELRWLKVTAK